MVDLRLRESNPPVSSPEIEPRYPADASTRYPVYPTIGESTMSLEESMLKLADAMDRYSAVMQSIASSGATHIALAAGGEIATTASATAAPAEKKGRGRPAKTEVEAAATNGAGHTEEIDPFADEEEKIEAAPTLTAAVIKDLVMRVNKEKGKDTALKLLKAVGVDTLSKIPESSYPRVVELATKVGISL